MNKLIFILCILFSVGLFAQPANDNCAGAQNLGTLGNPAACGTATVSGTTSTVAGTLNGATAENPYVTQAPCSVGTMATPANDVWYSFTMPALGAQVKIVISGAGFTPNVALWQGSCTGLVGRGCTVGTAGNATLVVPGMSSGVTYYIQISGNTGQTGTFNLSVNAFHDCANCNEGSTLTVNPLPVNGQYAPGQTVSFCYHVSSYTQVNTNWLHGVQLTFGAGWNAASLTTTPASSCDGNGTWAYYPAGITASASGAHWPAGFYYNSDLGGCSCVDANPGDNFGDNCSGTVAATTWVFCINLTVAAGCNPGQSLAVSFGTSGDGESGIWSNNGCASDPNTNFVATESCCPPNMSMTPVSCGGSGTAMASAVVGGAGSQAPYVFAWTGSSGPVATNTVAAGTTNTINNLPAGTYTVVVTDKNNCSSTNTITVTGAAGSITAPVTPHNITCAGSGSITTTNASGGTAAYTYNWTGPAAYSSTTQSPTGLTTAGVYTLVVTDASGCTFTTTATIAQTGSITVSVNSLSICSGTTATLTAAGGTTYSWSPGLSSNMGTSVTGSPGTTTSYTVIGTTGTCTNSAVATITIAPSLVVGVNSATICAGTSATLTATGGTTYSWAPAAGLSGTSGTSVTANPATTSTYIVTGNTGGCTGTATAVVTIAPALVVGVNSATICAGTSAALTATGGTTYSWTPAAGLSGTTGTSVTANPATTSTYIVTGNTGGCTGTATAVVTVNPNPIVTVTSTSVCSGNSGTITAAGATTYSWNTGPTTAAITISPTGTTSYTVTGTTANCTNTAVGTVTVVASVTVTVNDPIICLGSTTTLTATGATTYTWNTGPTTATIVTTPTITTSFTVAGEQNGCTGTSVGTVSVVSNPTVTVNSATICLGGSVTLTAAGASHYTWTPAAGLSSNITATVTANPTVTTTYTIVGAAGTCTTSSTATVTVNTLPVLTVTSSTICAGQQIGTLGVTGANTYTWTGGGITGSSATNPTDNPVNTTIYTVNGIDVNTCTATATGTITVNTPPVLTVTSASVCSGFGPSTLGVSGANTYVWTGGGITGSTSATPSDNPANTTIYTVNGTDVHTCTATATGTITVLSTPTISVNSGSICAGQTTLILNANSTATAFVWTPATGLSVTTGSSVIANPGATQVYTIVGSIGTCTASTTATVMVNTPPILTVTSSTICVGQQIGTLGVTGASTYVWTGGGITGSNATNPTDTPINTTVYTVNGTDVNTCTATATGTITVNPLPVVSATSGTVCVGQQTVTITASGANTYVWVPGTGLSATTGNSVSASPSSTQNYVITGTDIHGCTNTANTSVLVNTLPVVSATSAIVCAGFAGTMTASGANNYVWNTLATGATLTQTPATTTTYSVIGTDINGCIDTAVASITVNPSPLPVAASNTPCANQTLNLTCTPNGLTNYNWVGPNSYSATATQNPSIIGVTAATAGIYTVFVIDGNGCQNNTTIAIIINPLPVVTAVGSTVCVNQMVSLSCTPSGDIYSWSGQGGVFTSNLQNPTLPNAIVTMSGNYVVTVTDINTGCANGNVAVVVVNALPIVTATPGTICVGQQTTLTAGGASTYFWNPSTALSTPVGSSVMGFPASTTIYTVTGTDINGCVSTAIDSITVNPLPIVTTNTVSPDCIPLCTTFSATSTPAASTYNWSFGNGQSSTQVYPTTCFTAPGTYPVKVTIKDNQGCVNTASTTVTAFSIPIADFDYGQQPVTMLAPDVQFYNESTMGLPHYNWNFGDPYSTQANDTSALINPSHLYSVADTFFVTLTVSTVSGCSASVKKPVIINEYATLYVPNAFTPNGDGKNEIFLAEGVGISSFKMYIFDRWGLLLFYSEDITKGWNGTYQAKGTQLLQEDTYVWKIEATDFQNTARNLHGTVTLIK